jgi:hypothetical protein
MKFLAALIITTVGVSQAFSVIPSATTPTRTSLSPTVLAATPMDRRAMVQHVAASVGMAAAVSVGSPLPAFAGDYVPKVDDVKQIYFLGASLDRLKDKLGSPDTIEAALDGVRLFNKDPTFYPGYARNFILKTVKTGADADPRLGYIKQVSDITTKGFSMIRPLLWSWLRRFLCIV